jgi:tetratricopeptide (TPR) repeat protein
LEAIEGLYPERLGDQIERLAYHAFRGEVWDKATAYFRQAGAKALARSAYNETAVCFEQALEALEHLPESRDTLEQGIDLRLDLRAALIPPGEFERLLAHLNEAETLAQALEDQRRLARATCYMSNCFTQMGDRERGIEFGQHALTMARALGDFAIEVQTNYFLGQAYYSLGDYRLAMEVVRRNVVSLEGDLLRESFGQGGPASVSARAVLVRCLAEVGEFAEGIIRGEETIRIAEASDHPHIHLAATMTMTIDPRSRRSPRPPQLLNCPHHIQGIVVAVIGVEHQIQGTGTADAVDLLGKLGQGQDHDVWGSQDGARSG